MSDFPLLYNTQNIKNNVNILIASQINTNKLHIIIKYFEYWWSNEILSWYMTQIPKSINNSLIHK